MDAEAKTAAPSPCDWPEGLTRVPFWVFQRDDVYAREQKRLFQGAVLELPVP